MSKANSEIQRAVIDAQIRNPARSDNVPSHISANFHQRDVSAGLLPEKPSVPPVPLSIIMRRQQDLIAEYPVVDQSEHQPPKLSVIMYGGHKRKADQLTMAQKGVEEVMQKRAPKKCWKCEKTGCPGATGKHKCISACKSCGTYECPGKNSRHPTMSCPTLPKK